MFSSSPQNWYLISTCQPLLIRRSLVKIFWCCNNQIKLYILSGLILTTTIYLHHVRRSVHTKQLYILFCVWLGLYPFLNWFCPALKMVSDLHLPRQPPLIILSAISIIKMVIRLQKKILSGAGITLDFGYPYFLLIWRRT